MKYLKAVVFAFLQLFVLLVVFAVINSIFYGLATATRSPFWSFGVLLALALVWFIVIGIVKAKKEK